ncbi:MAG: 50S ribosomal protein L6 [uncultured bacterium]|nr:MAG: 50S ribosomal protein L6 [uncultured bacterium]
MSRLGRKPISIPQGVTVTVNGNVVAVKGSKGELTYNARPEIEVIIKDTEVVTSIVKETKESNAYWGLVRSLIASMIKGVTEGYEKKLELVGVGYRAKGIANGASLSLGFSHPIEFMAPAGIKIDVIDTQNITISGVDKQLVGLVAANIRKLRKPEPYKGKGIRYAGEVVRRKAGKSGKV